MKRRLLIGLMSFFLLWGGTILSQPTFFTETFDTDPSICATQIPNCWYIDRYQPEKFESEPFDGNNRLLLQINQNQSSYNRGSQSGSFYNTQGRKYDVTLPNHSFVSIDFYLDASWATKTRRTDLWATGFDGSNGVSAYPILGFVNFNGYGGDNYVGFRYWDSNDPGLWVQLPGFSFTYDTWYNLKFELHGETFYYYINDEFVGSYEAPDTETLGNIIIQGYNFDFPDGDTYYDIYYDNLKTGSTILLNSSYYTTIQSAINAASPNDIISVGAGIYNENIVVNKAVALNGNNAGIGCGNRNIESIIAPSTGLPFSVTSNGVTINGFEITSPGYQNAIVCGNTSNLNILYNNIHDIGTTVTGTNVHAINYTVANAATTLNVNISNNCFDYISSPSLTGWSAAAVGILQSTSTGDLTNLIIENNDIKNVNVNTGNWPTGKLAYGIIINVGGGSNYLSTTGKVVNATIRFNEISYLSGFISTGIGLEGNTDNAYVTNNSVSYLTGYKVDTRAGGGYDLNGIKFENNRYVSTCTVQNNSLQANTFTHNDPAGAGYALSNYVPTGLAYSGGTTGSVNATCNWLGAGTYEDIQDNIAMTGKVFSKAGCSLIYIPYLTNGTDASADMGFQPVAGACDNGYPVHNITAGTHHATIQAGIDAAITGDVIEVDPGIYSEQLYITTNNLSIEGAGKTSTIVKAPATALTNYYMIGTNKNCPVVYLNGVASCSIKNLTVDGDGKGNINYRFQGIGMLNSGANIQNVDVLRIWDTPFSGAQHGVGVYSYSTTGGPYIITIKNMMINDYQKNAMALLGNAVLDLDNITTIGEGATTTTAQNGIQVGPLTTGLIKNCNVQDVQYTGASWTASGMILDGDVNVENTTITGCQTSIYSIDANNNLANVNITAPLITVEEAYGVIAYSTTAAKSDIGLLQPSRIDEGENGGNRAASMTLNMTNCRLTGNDYANSIGVYLFSENSLTANILKCKFNDWDYAIYAEEYGTGTITATVNKCNLGNNNWGIYYSPLAASRAPLDGTENWWGDESGPSVGGKGSGSQVSANVNFNDWITDPVDIRITNPECGKLYVIAAPSMPLDGQVTNILFAVRWDNAAYPDEFLSALTDYNVNLQYYAIDGAFKYAVFGTDLAYINWDATVGDTIVEITLKQNQPEGTVSDFVIGDDAWTLANNADYYFEFWGSDLTGLITGFADDVYLGDCDLMLHAKVFLQGPYNTTTDMMNVDLTTNGPIPLAQPYSVAPWLYTGTETLATIPADMVDWVLVELRATPSGAAIRQAGLLFKDGTIRSAVPPHGDIYYTGAFMPNSDYYVAVFHRNHMPVMSANAVNIPNLTQYDLTSLANTYTGGSTLNALVTLETGVYGMIAGDVNKDGDLLYSNAGNDRALILQRIIAETGQTYINGVCQGYFGEDLTMNSWVKYSGSGNDQRLIILNLIELTGTYALNASYASLVPGWGAKALHVAPGSGPMDIALVENDNTLDVVLYTKENIPESWTDNIQFTLSWDENNVMMDQAVYNFTSDFKLAPQGEIMVNEGRKYMTFVVVDWIALPAPFTTGENVTVLSLNKGSWSGVPSKAIIAQDGFTHRNNGGFYVSLIGKDMTGQILETMTGIDNPEVSVASLKLYPNPATQGFVTMSLMPAVDETLTITVTDLSSRTVSMQQMEVIKGQPVIKPISLEGLSKGIYFIRLQGSQTFKTGKVEIQ